MAGVARGGAANVAGAVLSAVIGFALTVVVTRALPQAQAGVFFSTTSGFLVVVAVAQLGTNTGLVYFLSRARALDRPGDARSHLRAASLPVLGWTAVISAALVVAAPAVGRLVSPDEPTATATAVRVLAPFLLAASVENLAVSATRGLGTMRPTALLTLVVRPAAQLLLVGLASLTLGPAAAVAGWAAGYLVTAVAGTLWARRLLARSLRDAPPTGRRHREFWSFTWPRAIMTVAQMAMQRLDIVLVGALAGAVPAAVYAAATRFVVAGQMGSQAVTLAAQPRFAEHLAVDDTRSVGVLYRSSTAWLVLMTWPLYLALAAFSTTVVDVFGGGYDAGGAVVVILAVALMLSSLLGMVEVVLAMSGRTTWTLVNTLIGLGVQVGLDLVLIPRHGIIGAAIGWAAAIVLRNLLALAQVTSALRLHPFGASTVTAAVLGLVAAGVPLAVARLTLGDDVSALAVGLVVGGLAYVGGCAVLRRRLGLEELGAALRSRRRR
ncbi:oligosaccharide flippase family protein [Phycicoccus sonneratiae]|uniref:Polysaccharide biosynthesis protein n=1 Tax=Phycicoccus sonneratiae TaxID=2807628 RepID=A0ABS2CQC8_9MICO|nr:oligosaccharide flippase family protein [Phycicoccus sonneraticus]MBM6402079.1 polysaccharide biosynthesis protein [Phycicoccus sonneraticus]